MDIKNFEKFLGKRIKVVKRIEDNFNKEKKFYIWHGLLKSVDAQNSIVELESEEHGITFLIIDDNLVEFGDDKKINDNNGKSLL